MLKRVKFRKLLFWVPILAAGSPYWVLISQKVGSLLGPYFKAWGLICEGSSVFRSMELCPCRKAFQLWLNFWKRSD